MMNVRGKFVVAVVGATTALILFLPGPAAADDPLGGVVDETEGTVDDTVADTTTVVGETVDEVSQVVSDPTTADNTIQDVVADSTTGVGDTVTDVGGTIDAAKASTNDVVSVGQVGGGSIATDSSTGSTGSPGDTSDADGASGALDGDRERDRKDRSRTGTIGDPEWVWKPADRLASTWANLPAGARIEQVDAGDESDPCFDNPGLVCLGILYEIGRYAKSFSSVLGVLATTGIGVLGLMAIALALGTSGSVALAAARRRSAVTAGRA